MQAGVRDSHDMGVACETVARTHTHARTHAHAHAYTDALGAVLIIHTMKAAHSNKSVVRAVEMGRLGRMTKMLASRFGRLGNPKVAGSNPDLVFLNPGQIKPMTLKSILVASYPGAWHY